MDQLLAGLSARARKVADDFLAAFPTAVLTSGRRDLKSQAWAMAEDIYLAHSPTWILRTYAASLAARTLQDWLLRNFTSESTVSELANGLLGQMQLLTPEQLSHLSRHLSGDAFDIRPFSPGAPEEIPARAWLTARAVRERGKFLQKESGLTRWHFEL